MMEKKKVNYLKHSKGYYLWGLTKSFLTLRLLHDWIYSIVYNAVNHTLGKAEAKIGKHTKIHPSVFLRHGERIEIGHDCLINHNNVIHAGKNQAKIIIGNYVQTGPNVMMFAFNHGTDPNGVPMINQDYYEAETRIDDDVWIGAGTVITAGVHIGEGCVIGAGSVVTKDMPAGMLCAGIPCKPIKKR